ncbi:MAG: 3-methyl-2-oxobutanoate hydroxymethyltransferase [Rubrivivax sp.]|jgi:3-methyl-2-oxobutanoate hydroxymethyltransferase
MTEALSLSRLQQMKRDGRKIVGVVAWDVQMARIVDRAGVDLVSVGDSVGVNLWGHAHPLEVTMDEMVVVTRAVRRGVRRALLSVDFPFGPLQQGVGATLEAAIRFVKECGVDMVKVDGAVDQPEAVRALVKAGIPVFAHFGITPQTALRYGIDYATMMKSPLQIPAAMTAELVEQARMLEAAGASMLDFQHSGPVAGAAVAAAVAIPVIGGQGGGPWLDGRMRMAHAAIGYAASTIDQPPDTYAHVAKTALEAISAYADDVRSARQIRGGIPVRPLS